MRKRVVRYFLSAASVYITLNYLTKVFVDIMSNFTFAI